MQNAVNVYKMLRTTHNEYFTTSNSSSDASTHQRNPIDSYIEAQAHPLSKKKTDTRALPHCTRLVPQLHQMRVHIVKRSLPLHSPPPPPKKPPFLHVYLRKKKICILILSMTFMKWQMMYNSGYSSTKVQKARHRRRNPSQDNWAHTNWISCSIDPSVCNQGNDAA